jgi:hypothetical protein
MVTVPIWFVVERKQPTVPSCLPCDEPDTLLAFTTTEKLTAFLSRRTGGEWKIILASDREEIVLIIALAHNSGQEAICVDSQPDGSGGSKVTLTELMQLADSLRSDR